MATITTQKVQLGDSELILEHGRFAAQAGGAIVCRMGDTMVFATAVASKNESTLDYFPLSVEYLERLYAGGRISSSRFIKREGRPSDVSILTARLIDRSIRPLFPKGFKNEVQVVVTVLSVDHNHTPDILGVIAASAALAISDIPWNGPLSGARIGWDDTSFVPFPTLEQLKSLKMDLVVSGSASEVVMVEAGMSEVVEDVVLRGIDEAQKYNKAITEGIAQLATKVGKEKFAFTTRAIAEDAKALISEIAQPLIMNMVELAAAKKLNKEDALGALIKEVSAEVGKRRDAAGEGAFPEITGGTVAETVEYLFKKTIRQNTLSTGKRADGRAYDEVRDLEIEVGILPRTHGSAMFQRGMTQTLTVVTLASPALEQIIENADGEFTKRYMHHYNFPPYSVGEAKRMGSPGRREIGHGALAERALIPVLPPVETFPYTIRVVNEIMSSNGSSSMASVCGSTLSLMDAGVPVTAAVAGVAMGLMTNDTRDQFAILTDIQGLEDATGDMDFKVAGTAKGITALQMDIKLSGLKSEWLHQALSQARDARLHILNAMLAVIPSVRPTLSQYAPRVVRMMIHPDQIGLVIGGGGKTINQIIAACGVEIDIKDDGAVTISGTEDESIKKAQEWILGLTKEIKVGEVYEGEVKRTLAFGAFVEILPGKEGMVHISKLAPHRVNSVEDVVQVGDHVTVRVDEIDSENRVNLTLDVAGTWEKDMDNGGGRGNGGGNGGGYSDGGRRFDRSRGRRD